MNRDETIVHTFTVQVVADHELDSIEAAHLEQQVIDKFHSVMDQFWERLASVDPALLLFVDSDAWAE